MCIRDRYEPTQVTYRTLTYYYGPATVKPVPAAPVTAPSKQRTVAEAAPIENKPAPTQPTAVISTPPVNVSEKPAPVTPAPVTPTSAEANASKEDVRPAILRISEEVLRKAAVALPQPQYPADAEMARASGPV